MEASLVRSLLLEGLFDLSTVILFAHDAEGRYLLVNTGWEAATGIAREQVIGRTFEEVWPEEVAAEFHTQRLSVLETGQSVQREQRIETTQGVRWFDTTLFPITPETTSEQIWFGGLAVDITTRVRAEQERRESRAMLETVVENSGAAIYVKDAGGRYLLFNRTAELLSGLSREQVLGRTDREVFPQPWADIYRENDRKVLESGQRMEFEERGELTGQQCVLLSVKVPLYDEKGRACAVCGLSTDITDRILTETRLRESQAFLEQIAAVTPVVLYAHDVIEQHNVYVNAQIEAAMGFTPDEWLAMSPGECAARIHPDDRTSTLNAMRSLVAGQVSSFEYRMRHKDGMYRWFLCHDAVLTREPDGSPRLIVGAAQDITGRKQVEESLRNSEAHLRQVLESIPQLVFIGNADGTNQGYSRRWVEYTGIDLNGAVGDEWLELVHPDDRETAIAAWERAQDGQNAYEVELRFRRHDGVYRWHLIRSLPLHNDLGQPVRWFGTLTDIHDTRNHREEIAELNTRLLRSMRETHHRVKNNLQVISALAEMLIGVENASTEASLRRISRHARSLATIHDLLTGQTQFEAEEEGVSSVEMLDKLMGLMQQTAGVVSIQFAVSDFRLSPRTASSLALLVNELVSNATKHGRSEVYVALQQMEGSVCLRVEDDGSGFPLDFDPRRAANTGLDLIDTISRLDLRGTVHFANREEGGASVTVLFPLL